MLDTRSTRNRTAKSGGSVSRGASAFRAPHPDGNRCWTCFSRPETELFIVSPPGADSRRRIRCWKFLPRSKIARTKSLRRSKTTGPQPCFHRQRLRFASFKSGMRRGKSLWGKLRALNVAAARSGRHTGGRENLAAGPLRDDPENFHDTRMGKNRGNPGQAEMTENAPISGEGTNAATPAFLLLAMVFWGWQCSCWFSASSWGSCWRARGSSDEI